MYTEDVIVSYIVKYRLGISACVQRHQKSFCCFWYQHYMYKQNWIWSKLKQKPHLSSEHTEGSWLSLLVALVTLVVWGVKDERTEFGDPFRKQSKTLYTIRIINSLLDQSQ